MYYFNINKKMKYLTDKNLSLNAKGLLSIILFQEEINEDKLDNYCSDDNKTIKYALLQLKFNRYIKYDAGSGNFTPSELFELTDWIPTLEDLGVKPQEKIKIK